MRKKRCPRFERNRRPNATPRAALVEFHHDLRLGRLKVYANGAEFLADWEAKS